MSCRVCFHFYADEGNPKFYGTPDAEHEGHCTLHPVWLKVNGAHFCSHMLLYSHRTGNMGAREHAAWERAESARQRAMAAEKTLKKVRKELRELKAR